MRLMPFGAAIAHPGPRVSFDSCSRRKHAGGGMVSSYVTGPCRDDGGDWTKTGTDSNVDRRSTRMNAADVMVTEVITVGPDALVQDVAHLLLTNRISAVPVVASDGRLLGIVSEGDLMRRAEAGTGRRRSWWLAALTGREPTAADYVKEHARKVTDVMTRRVITAPPDTPLRDIANLLEKNGIKRVPIVENGKVVGIVSRANLLQALASLRKQIEG